MKRYTITLPYTGIAYMKLRDMVVNCVPLGITTERPCLVLIFSSLTDLQCDCIIDVLWNESREVFLNNHEEGMFKIG